MNILDIMKTTQQGGPTEAAIQEYMKNNKLTPKQLVEKHHEAVKAAKEKKKPATWSKKVSGAKVPRKSAEYEAMNKEGFGRGLRRFSKAHGGYVKKYAKGGGVRKVRR